MRYLFCVLLAPLLPCFLYAQPLVWQSRGTGGGGALFSLSINPANSNEYYVSCDMGELFHTTNFGQSYDQVNFTELIGGHNSRVAFTAAGDRYSVSYANNQIVPMKSTDGGGTWNPLPGNPDPSEETFHISADYNNAARVIIAYYGSIHFSSNGGSTFTQIHTALSGAGNVIGGTFFDGNTIFIGTNDGVLVSVNGGGTWNLAGLSGLPVNERIFSFAAGKSGNVTRLFCLTGDVNDIYVGLVGSDYWGFYRGVYSCDYGSGNWIPKNTGIVVNTDYPMFVAMAENDINTVYLAGSNSNAEPNIMKTVNAGSSWTRTFTCANNQNISTGWSGQGGDRGWSYGECPFGISVKSNDPNYVIFGDFGFVHKTSNGGTQWQQAYTDVSDQHPSGSPTPPNQYYHSAGIENTTCWQVFWADASNMFACYSDIRGKRSQDGGLSWSFDYTGHNANSMYRIIKHPQNSTLFAGTSSIHDMYQSTRLQDNPLDNTDNEGKIIYSLNNGASWSLLHLFSHPVFWIAIDPNNPNRAYASVIHYNAGNGLGGVYRCDDLQNLSTSTWTLLPTPPRTQKHPASLLVLNDGKLVATYSGRRNSSGTFQNCSGTFLYDPILNTWTDISDPGMYYWTKDIVLDPNDPLQNTWYVCVFSGWGGPPNGLGGLYRTNNRGSSWVKLTGTQFDRVSSITFHPFIATQIYLTTEGQGLWISNNITAANPTFTAVGNYPFQQPERVFFNPYNANHVWVTSFGNGMKTGDMTLGEQPPEVVAPVFVYPNPGTGIFMVTCEESCTVELFGPEGRLLRRMQFTSGTQELNIGELDNGLYFLKTGTTCTRILLQK
ncbi:MAG: hypothetical protein IT233_10850 [Bacteroidia bacterium]|nr:hypothetical protein [Bacteroidia bacterium]